MFAVLGARVRSAVRRVLGSVVRAVRETFQPAPLVTGFVEDLFRSPDGAAALRRAPTVPDLVFARAGSSSRPSLPRSTRASSTSTVCTRPQDDNETLSRMR